MRVVTLGSGLGTTESIEVGSPAPLARLYASHPLATAFGFFATGWGLGYASWWAFGKPTRRKLRRRRR